MTLKKIYCKSLLQLQSPGFFETFCCQMSLVVLQRRHFGYKIARGPFFFCRGLYNYIYSQSIHPRSIYVQLSPPNFLGTFMYSSLLLQLQPIDPSQKRLCTDLSYYNYSQYILPRNVYVQISLITIIANRSFPVTFMYRSLLLRLQPIHPSQ